MTIASSALEYKASPVGGEGSAAADVPHVCGRPSGVGGMPHPHPPGRALRDCSESGPPSRRAAAAVDVATRSDPGGRRDNRRPAAAAGPSGAQRRRHAVRTAADSICGRRSGTRVGVRLAAGGAAPPATAGCPSARGDMVGAGGEALLGCRPLAAADAHVEWAPVYRAPPRVAAFSWGGVVFLHSASAATARDADARPAVPAGHNQPCVLPDGVDRAPSQPGARQKGERGRGEWLRVAQRPPPQPLHPPPFGPPRRQRSAPPRHW